ncbi:MAG TPA: alpha/beta hydrolase, partial [Candidatus Manganitrophaceae bacterium]
MAPVARELAEKRGVLEPLQTKDSIEALIGELKLVLEEEASGPAVLIGHSWGAWLGFLFAARHPALVQRLVLVSSGPFEEKYASRIMASRLKRLSEQEQKEVHLLQKGMKDPDQFARLGELMSRADFYDPLPMKTEGVELRPDLFQRVWGEASELRKSGKLLRKAGEIKCPVTAIHGDHDPHPAEGVEKPLAAALNGFKFILLEKCGHIPWMEK